MEPLLYAELPKQEKHHWWWISRRAIVYTLLQGISITKSPLILDAGCGSGGNLPMLSTMGDVFAMEVHEPVLTIAQKRKIGRVELGQLPGPIPFPEIDFDLVTLFDVLEHVEDDQAALNALVQRMNPRAVMCLTVPAYQWLFSRTDREAHHFRRYGKKQLQQLLENAGLEVQLISYWNCFLLPIAIVVRVLEKFNIKREKTIGFAIPAPWLNKLLRNLVSSERFIIPLMPLPFGLSIIALARKI